MNRNGNDGTITRFGWKAQNQSLLLFSGEAYNVEMGITNELFQSERDQTASCQFAAVPNDTQNFDAADAAHRHHGDPELRELPALPRAADAFHGLAGRGDVDRARQEPVLERRLRAVPHAHAQDQRNSAVAALRDQDVNLFSDLLVHDMGVGLADGVSQGAAGPREFRTAPLWGLGQAHLLPA